MNGTWLTATYLAGPLLMATGAAMRLPDVHWKRVALGLVLVVVGSAAALVAPAPPASFFTINNVLLWSGLALAAWGAAGCWPQDRAASVVALAGIAVALFLAHSLLELGSVGTSIVIATFLAIGLGWVARTMVPAAPSAPSAPRSARIHSFTWALIALLGVPALWLILTIAGPGALSVEGLREAPFSEAAETLLAALLLPLTIVLSGGWGPRQGGWPGRLVTGARYALLGTSLLVGVVLPLLPDGMLHWRSAYAAVVLVLGLVAALRAAWPELLSLGSLYLAAIGGIGNWPASLLLAAVASILAGPGAAWPAVVRRALLLGAAIAVIAAYPTALGVEVIYSVVAALIVMLAVLRTPGGAAQ